MICMTRSGERGVLVYLDASGASMSTLCAAHCVLTPMVATLLPVIGLGILVEERTEFALMALSASLGIASLGLGYRVHRSRRAVVVLVAGLCLLASGRVAEGWEYERIGLPLVVGGGLVVASSHLLNRRLCRSCRGDRRSPEARDGTSSAFAKSGQSSERRADPLKPETLP
jgi:MerC mercury resistance protein